VQAKGRSALMESEVHLVVWAQSLNDDRALLVSGLVMEGRLGPMMLVVPEGDFKRLAELSTRDGPPVYSELLVLHLLSRGVLGLQIKRVSVEPTHPAATVSVLASSFRASPTTNSSSWPGFARRG
jgi:hypothetical protein